MNIPELTRNSRRKIGEAIHDFSLIRDGDRLMVGLSGGKDSLVLLLSLKALQMRSPVSFGLEACTVDATDGQTNYRVLRDFCASFNVPYKVIPVPIYRLIEERNEQSPCSFCANFRRGVLSSAAHENGCSTLCLGHHLDDVVETTLMNLFFSGRFDCFMPLTWQDRTALRVIRPLVYLEESQISREAERLHLPVLDFLCRFSPDSRRAWVKKQVAILSQSVSNLKQNFLHALRSEKSSLKGWHLPV
ncbi:MAG: tRNA 2-thiocytidine biosynthesis TtcA family protein [Synergistales bacterium]